jgi:hypothetical protein
VEYFSVTKKNESPVVCNRMDGTEGHCVKKNKLDKDKHCLLSLIGRRQNN